MIASEARRAGRALFEATRATGQARPTLDSLLSFGALLDAHDDLRQVLLSPFVPAPNKRAVVDQIAALAPMAPAATQVLGILADQHQFDGLSGLTREFKAQVDRLERRVDGEVTTATPLAAGQLETLRDALSHATGQQVTLTARVDPALIGGAITRVGSIVYDGSLRNQLARLKQQFVQG